MLILPDRAIVSLQGPDTLALLERTVTHAVSDWPVGTWRAGALLTPQGKIIADYLAERTADGVRLDVHAAAAENLIRRMKLFRLRAAVEIDLCTDFVVVADEAGAPDPRCPNDTDLFRRRMVPVREMADAGRLDPARWNLARIGAGIPEWGSDYGAEEVFPTDVNLDVMNGIDYKKGCFIGQEVAEPDEAQGRCPQTHRACLGHRSVEGRRSPRTERNRHGDER